MKLVNFWPVFIFLSSFSASAFTPRSVVLLVIPQLEIKLDMTYHFHLEPDEGMSQPASQLSGVPIHKKPFNINKVLRNGW